MCNCITLGYWSYLLDLRLICFYSYGTLCYTNKIIPESVSIKPALLIMKNKAIIETQSGKGIISIKKKKINPLPLNFILAKTYPAFVDRKVTNNADTTETKSVLYKPDHINPSVGLTLPPLYCPPP